MDQENKQVDDKIVAAGCAIEAILFYKAEPMRQKKLAELLKLKEEDIVQALSYLETSLADRGIRLVRKEDEVMLGTSPEASELIEQITKEELSKDLGRAAIETLAIILYKGPLTRPDIDYIRGVNSSFILRNLMVRGLVERVPKPEDSRTFIYKPTFELLSYLGIENIGQMPDYDNVQSKIENFLTNKKEEEEKE